MPNVTIIRAHQYQGGARKMRIYRGDQDMGYVKNGHDLELDLPAEQLVLTAKMDWCRTDVELDLSDGEDRLLEVGFWGSALSMIFRPREAIFFRQVDTPPLEQD